MMMDKRRSFVFLFLLFSVFSTAQKNFIPVADIEGVGKKLDGMAKSLHSIHSDFVQEKHMSFLDMNVVTKGKFWFKKENSLRWEYTDPFSYVVVIKDGNLLIKDDEKSSEMKIKGNRIFQHVNDIIVASVTGEIMEKEGFETFLFESNTEYFIQLVSTNPEVAKVIKEMHMYFDKASLSLEKIKMMEPNADYTLIHFENRKINESIPASVFNINN